MIEYKARGIVLGNYWGGGYCGYEVKLLKANSRKELDEKIEAGIKDGSLDSGMGFESLIGAIMVIETVDSRMIDGKQFIARDYEDAFYGNLSEEQQDILMDMQTCS